MTVYYRNDYDRNKPSSDYVSMLLTRLNIASQLTYDDRGKPMLVGRSDLYLSISHSADIIIMIVANCRVGIDIELIKPRRNYRQVATRMLNCSVDSITDFYCKWTAFEAQFKASLDDKSNTRNEVILGNYMIAVASECQYDNIEYIQL